jgi:hypothetical protein
MFKNTEVEAEAKAKFKVIIEDEFDPQSPRDPNWQDSFGHIVAWHRNYNLGDPDNDGFADPDEAKEQFEENADFYLYRKPLYLFDHSGITVSTKPFRCQWDSCQVGWVYFTKQDLMENDCLKSEDEITPELIKERSDMMERLVEEYARYLEGEVYYYKVIEVDEDGEEVDEYDACGNMIGRDYVEQHAEEIKQIAIKEYIEEHTK